MFFYDFSLEFKKIEMWNLEIRQISRKRENKYRWTNFFCSRWMIVI